MASTESRLFSLDFLRAISVILIIVFHFNQQLGFHLIVSNGVFVQNFKNDNIGSIGISLFIMLSGASLMLRYREKFSWKDYLFKRFLSIFPTFWVGYIIIFVVLFIINTGLHTNANPWTFLLTVIGMDGFLYYKIPNYYLVGEWFVGFILIMYVLFPFLRIGLLKRPLLTIITIFGGYIIAVTNYTTVFNIDIIHNPLTRLPEFLLGMLLVRYMEKVNIKLLLPSVIIAVYFFLFEVDIPHIYRALIISSTLFMVFSTISHIIKRESIRRLFLFISKYSFPAFIIHHNLIGQFLVLFDTKTLSNFETYILFFILTILIFRLAIPLAKISNELSSNLAKKLVVK